MRIPLHEINARELKNSNANIILTLSIAGIAQLNNLITKLKKVNGVISGPFIKQIICNIICLLQSK